MNHKEELNAKIAAAADALKVIPPLQQMEVITLLALLDKSVLQSEAFVEWAKSPEMAPLLEDHGIKVRLLDGHAVALGKGGEKLAEANSRAANLRDLFSSLGMAMDCSIKSGKIDGASIAIQLTVK